MPPSTRRRSNFRRKVSKNFAVVPDLGNIPLVTLADGALLLSSGGVTITQALRYISSHVWVNILGLTATEGPLIFGLAQSGMTGPEVLEGVNAIPTSQLDLPAAEFAKRNFRTIGQFPGLVSNEALNNGNRIKVRLSSHIINDGAVMPRFWVLNRSGGPMTTGAVIKWTVKHYGMWK